MRTTSYSVNDISRMADVPEEQVIKWIDNGQIRATWGDINRSWSIPLGEIIVAKALAEGCSLEEARERQRALLVGDRDRPDLKERYA